MATRSNARPSWGRYPLTDWGQNPAEARFSFWTRGTPYPNFTGDPDEPVDPPSYYLPHVERSVRRNEAEYGTARSSATGVALKALVGARGIVREQPPVIAGPRTTTPPHRFTNLIGVFASRAAKAVPVIPRRRYQGQLPQSQQPKLKKPYPWADPTRGLP